MPAISVIVPVYQAEALLPQCVESVLAQTFSDWELAAHRRWQPGRFSDPVRRLRRKRPPHSRVPQAQRRRVHRPESGVRAGHGTVYRFFGRRRRL